MTKLVFTTEYNRTRRDYRFKLTGNENIWTVFSSDLEELWPGIKLPSPGSLSFRQTDKDINLHCKKPLTINGVSVTDRTLKPGDRIILGPIRIFYNSTETEQEAPAPVPAGKTFELPEFNFRRIKLLPAAIISAAVIAAVIAGCVTGPWGKSAEETPGPGLQTAVTEAAPKLAEQTIRPEPVPEEDFDSIIVIPPGGTVPDFDLDVLFIHAHPDDESLDFGCLMALAEAGGLKTGLVTFTDGEAGLDNHPFRPTTGIYPEHEMKGAELASVRKIELQRAAKTLGVDLLIRLGLKNHPYNSTTDELTPEEILRIWGGRDALAAELGNIITKTSPETVAAPDGPSAAREHFEHEAVGYLTAGVIARLDPFAPETPKRFITCVDPRQHELYPEVSVLDAGISAGKNGNGETLSLRQRQLSALFMHNTQNDAVNVGAGFLPEYDYEYYKIQYWQSNSTWNEWIAELDKSDNRLAQTAR